MTEYLTPKEAAAFLRRSVGTIYNMKLEGKLPCLKPGGRTLLFRREDLEAWVEKSAVPSREEIERMAACR